MKLVERAAIAVDDVIAVGVENPDSNATRCWATCVGDVTAVGGRVRLHVGEVTGWMSVDGIHLKLVLDHP